jgi:alpha-tubulin suppressor-like RCC1 family protein
MKRHIATVFTVSLLLFCNIRNGSVNLRDNPYDPGGVDYIYKFSAAIYEPDGKEPSEGAVVRLFDVNSRKNEPVFAAVTNDRGYFSISKLPVGMYRLLAEKDSLVLFQDSLVVTPTYTTLRDDTLECPSSITGTVGMEEYHDRRSVTVEIAGMDMKPVTPDTSGKFTLTGLADGTWPLLFGSTLPGYLPTIATVTVPSCSHDTIDDTLFIMHSHMPIVGELNFTQDTLAGTLRISWQKPDFEGIRDYLIFRSTNRSIDSFAGPAFASADTLCIDSIYSLPAAHPDDTAPRYLGYRITVRNSRDEIGPTGRSFEVAFAPKAYVTTFFTHNIDHPHAISSDNSTVAEDMLHSDDNASIGDTVTLSFTATNRTRPLRRFSWYDPATRDTVSTHDIDDTLAFEVSDTLQYSNDSAGDYQRIACVVDDAGARWFDTIRITFVNDPPDADAGADRSVLTCDTIRLHGKATQQFGSISVWEWKIGFGAWTRTSGPDTAFAASAFREAMVCSLAVTDDDSNRSLDAVSIDVIVGRHIEEIAAGGFHSLFLNNKGILLGCGLATSGQLGVKDSLTSELTVPRKMAIDVQNMDGGDCHTLFVHTDGIARACGWNHYGQLGDGTTGTRFEPVQVMTGVRLVAAGANHSLFLKTDGTLRTCGNNRFGQLGDGTLLDRSSPVQIMNNVQQIAAGANHSLILATDGTLWACGLNSDGQLGDSTIVNRLMPVKIMTEVKAAAAGNAHSLMIKNDGSLWACGLNSAGQLGDTTGENSSKPIKIMEDVQQIAAGNNHTLILTTDGSLLACGENGMGQLGDTTTINRLTPVKIAADVDRIAAGGRRSLMIKKEGTVWNWGWDTYDRNGGNEGQFNSIPVLCIP